MPPRSSPVPSPASSCSADTWQLSSVYTTFANDAPPQSAAQLTASSPPAPLSQMPLPQPRPAQSCGHEPADSGAAHEPSPHVVAPLVSTQRPSVHPVRKPLSPL